MISFVVPTHNYGKYLIKCIDSIFNNDVNLIDDVIIVNDSSSDNTKLIIEKLVKKYDKIKYFEVSFRSLSKTMNFGIDKTSSKFISKIDADDWLSNDFTNILYNELIKKDLDYIYGDLIVHDEKKCTSYIKSQKIHKLFKKIYYPVGSGTIFKKKIWEQIGGYNELIYYQDDYDFWLKLNKLFNIRIGYIKSANYNYRKHHLNMSKNIIQKNITKYKILLKNI